jgi:Repeating coiled region of VPS13
MLGPSNLSRLFKTRSKSRPVREDGFKPLEPELPPSPIVSTIPKATRVPTTLSSGRTESSSVTLLEAMTVRLGKKIWFVHFKIFHASVTVTLLAASDEEIVMLNSEMAGTIKYFGRGKMDYFFDVSRFEAADCQTQSNEKGKLLVLNSSASREKQAPDDYEDVSDDNSSDISADLVLTPSFTGDEVKQATSFLELPPPGVVCRLAAVRDKGTTKLSFASHPATLMWTRQCFDAVAEFFGAPSTKMQTELTSHLKHVATPLARKAQLAFLSQSTLILHVNVAAPKLWVPFLSKGSDGALCFDAGNLKYSYKKEEGQSTISWSLETSDIQVNFARWHLSLVSERMANSFGSALPETSRQHGVTSIIRPFQVSAGGGMNEKHLATKISSGETLKYSGAVRYVDIKISTIALNLVDAEVLARAIGKWYSQGLLSFRGRSSSKNRSRYTDQAAFSNTYEIQERAMRNFQSRNSTPHCLSLTIDKVEMALEGHSKHLFSDEKSIESHETSQFGQFSSPTRTYVVEIFQLKTSRTKNHDIIATTVLLADASIVQLKNSSEYTPMNKRHEARESQYCILERGQTTGDKGHNEEAAAVLSIGMLHDGTVHLDEVEIDVEPVILRVTPTSLKDCTKGIRKIVEIGQVLTREMERKVHEEGRKARQRDQNNNRISDSDLRPVSPAFSITSEMTETHTGTERSDRTASSSRSPLDSSLIVKLTIKDGCLLAGRPTFSSPFSRSSRKVSRTRQAYSFAVVQVVSNALIMFQSVENADSSGSKTLHVSLDNLSGSVDTEFEKLSLAQSSPMIGPTGAEFRLVSHTENSGWAVSNDISLDCEHLRSCLTPNDLSILISIVDIMVQRLRGIHTQVVERPDHHLRKRESVLSSLLKYQKKGTGIATNIRIELQKMSFVVLRTFESKYGAPEFLSFNLKDFKTRLSGCMSALAGECFTGISVDFYNPEISEWEEVVEHFPIKMLIDQMPNELIIDASTSSSIQLNLTGIFLRDFSELDVGSFQKPKDGPFALTPSALSTVGLRRATETHVVEVHNHMGIDIEVDVEGLVVREKKAAVRFDSYGPGLIKNNGHATFDALFDNVNLQQNLEEIAAQTSKMSLRFPASSADVIGEREPVKGLPVVDPTGASTMVHLLKPDSLLHVTTSHHERSCLTPSRKAQQRQQKEEDSVLTSSSVAPDYAYYHAEPVVEWCMQNQRLRSSTVDLYSLDKGRDLLSSSYWSPEEDYNVESIGLAREQGFHATFEGIPDENEEGLQRQVNGLTNGDLIP